MIVINSKKIPIIALEGMPRSGKTSVFKRLYKESTNNYSFIKELYFSKKQLAEMEDKRGTIIESKWFIDQEIKRRKKLIKNCISNLVIADRMYLSVLAYCFARSKINKNPEEFEELVNYLSNNKTVLIDYDAIVIFDNDIETAQMNRRLNVYDEDMEYWMNIKFMEYFRGFYINFAHKFTNAKIFRLNSKSLKLDDIYKEIRGIIDKYEYKN